MDYQLSLFSQMSNQELVTFSYTSYEQALYVIKKQAIGMMFLDLADNSHKNMLIRVKKEYQGLVCVGIGQDLNIYQQKELFSLGLDDYVSQPISEELFNIRMKQFLYVVETKLPTATRKIKEFDELPFDAEDIEDLEELLKSLHLQILLMGKSEVSLDDVHRLTMRLGKIQSYFMYMVATFPLSTSLSQLCEVIEGQSDYFIAHSDALSTIALAFVNDLTAWKNALFYEKNQKPDFLNESIIANVKTFISLFHLNVEHESLELDSIFEF